MENNVIKFIDLNSMKPKDFGPGLTEGERVLYWGDKIMVVRLIVEPDMPYKVRPLHSHPQEQLGYIIEGGYEVITENGVTMVTAGQGFIIPPNIPHAGGKRVPGKRLVALDIFSPPREDYMDK
jgi:quercetin dioxygenase-like cupin family protein